MKRTNFFTTEAAGWRPFFKENAGYAGLPLHDVLEKAGLDFQAIKVPTSYRLPGSDRIFESSNYSVIRTDTGEELGFGFSGGLNDEGEERGYHVVQTEEALGQIFQDVLNLENSAICVNAIGFDNGARQCISFRLPDEYMVRPGDNQKMYLNFFNSFNGTDGVGGSWHILRPVCINTFADARANGVNGYFTRHTRNAGNRLQLNAPEILGIARKEFEKVSQEFQKWATIKVGPELETAFLFHMHPDSGNLTKSGKPNAGPENKRELLMTSAHNNELADPNEITIWDLFCGATKVANYARTPSRQDDVSQYEFALFGTGNEYMNKAKDFLTKAVAKA